MSPGEWSAIVGWSSDGRNEVTREVLHELRTRGVRLGGCLQDAIREGDEIVGYDLVDLDDGRRLTLARPSHDPTVCNWGFEPRTFAAVAARVLERVYDLVVLELGPIEARGRGHWETVTTLLQSRGNPLLLCIRPRVLARIALELPDPVHTLELPATREQVVDFTRDLVAARDRQADVGDPQQRA